MKLTKNSMPTSMGFEDVEEWTEEWEIADTEEKASHVKHWVDLPPRHNTRQK